MEFNLMKRFVSLIDGATQYEALRTLGNIHQSVGDVVARPPPLWQDVAEDVVARPHPDKHSHAIKEYMESNPSADYADIPHKYYELNNKYFIRLNDD